MPWRGVLAGLLLAALAEVGISSQTTSQQQNVPDASQVETGNDACSGCHGEIYKSYGQTGMANSSGLARDGVIAGEFNDKISGVRYRVYPDDAHVWMSYERQSEKFEGKRELLYFLGANRKGRSYLFSDEGFLFEAPINWYSQEGHWGMMPAYLEARHIPMNLPASIDCMNCHASGLQAPIAGTDNKFSRPPFQHGGVSCQRCHGGDVSHGQKNASIVGLPNNTPTPDTVGLDNRSETGQTSIEEKRTIVSLPSESQASRNKNLTEISSKATGVVNPAKLPPDRRDAICMQCHFQGTVAVEQPGKHLYQFQPGEKLSDYVHYFLLSGNEPETGRTLSQFEALSLSKCKRRSRDRMWCGTCHDPHAEPAAEEKAVYYRSKCLNCHGEEFAAKHYPDKPDCTKCHMPTLPSKDVAHTESTDHRILRYPNTRPLPRLQVRGPEGAPLVSFPERDTPLATTRDFALGWEALAQRNFAGAAQEAEEYLRKAVGERPNDPLLLEALGLVEQKHDRETEARELYEHALILDPLLSDAAANLGILEAKSGNLRHAVELWNPVFVRAPYRSAIGLNLAMSFCVSGQTDVARKYVERVLEFNPDYLRGKQLLAHLGGNPVQCKP